MVQPKKKFLQIISLSSKRFCLVSEQKKDRGTGFSILAAREMQREPKNVSIKLIVISKHY